MNEPGGAEISCAGPDHLISRQPTAVANSKVDVWTRTAQFRRAGAHGLHLSRSIPLTEHYTHAQTGFAFCPLRFVMAALKRTRFVPFALPLSNPPLFKRNIL
jgi:hypothetical protein